MNLAYVNYMPIKIKYDYPAHVFHNINVKKIKYNLDRGT